MKITRNKSGTYKIRLTPGEFEALGVVFARGEQGGKIRDALPSKGARRAWSQRINKGHFLRIDLDNMENYDDFDS